MKGVSVPAMADLLDLLSRMMHARGYQHDLFPAQWLALRYFARAEPLRCTASELARFQGMANGPVSRTVRTLVQKGLLVKSKLQVKGKSELLELSPAGHALIEKDPLDEVRTLLSKLESDEQFALAVALEKLIRGLQSSATQPTFHDDAG